MIGAIVYILGCAAVSAVLTCLYVMFRPVNSRDELKSWRILGFAMVLTLLGPYGYAEVVTRIVGPKMEHSVLLALDDAGVKGDLQYYRVIMYSGSTARVVAVAAEKADWGGSDRPVLAITLKREGDSWKPDSYKVVSSFNRNQDGFTFPPYY